MMKYCINVVDIGGSINYRLQLDGSWSKCIETIKIHANDRVFLHSKEVLETQLPDVALKIGSQEFTINSSSGINYGERNNLYYEVYGFHDVYPEPPSKSQLEDLLIKGDDSNHNTLILRSNGQFDLLNPTSISINKGNPDFVYQFEGFVAGNGYVGPTINDDSFESYIMEYFRTGMHYWRDHLVYKIMHEQADTFEGHSLEDLLDIYDDLKKMKMEFSS